MLGEQEHAQNICSLLYIQFTLRLPQEPVVPFPILYHIVVNSSVAEDSEFPAAFLCEVAHILCAKLGEFRRLADFSVPEGPYYFRESQVALLLERGILLRQERLPDY